MSARYRRTPRRPWLSQHFLRSGALAAKLVAQARVSPQDLVLEIGPGRGALTAPLAGSCGELIAVEIDSRLCGLLREQFRRDRHVSIIHGDALRVELPTRPYKVVGNIPFSSTAAIMRRLVDGPFPPSDAYLVTQREAAYRFAGGPHAPESLVSLLLKPDWQVEIVRQFRRGDFDPPPRVHTVLLWLARRPRSLVHATEREPYRHFVRSCFGQGGNTIRQCLGSSFTRVEIRRLSIELRFRPDEPPSGLTFDQWLGLFRFYAPG